MNIQGFVLAVATFGLVACMPDTEINADNVETILAASSVTTDINDTVHIGVQSQASLTKSLNRLSAKALSNFYVEDKCLNDTGDYQFTGEYSEVEPEFKGQFNLAFNQCRQPKATLDGVVAGSFSGHISEQSLSLDYTLSGGIDIKRANHTIRVSDYSADVLLEAQYSGLTQLEWTIQYSHAGVYQYNAHAYKGRITAQTITDVRWSFLGSDVSEVVGEVHYKDDDGNLLAVVHSENGVTVSLNDQWVRTYSHEDWLKKF